MNGVCVADTELIVNNVSGVYKIQSIIKPNKFYVGSTINLSQRRDRHKYELTKRFHANTKLQRHCDKYSIDDLIFSVIEYCDICQLIEKEQYYIDILKPWFNMCPVAGSCLGVLRSDETKQKMSEKLIGNTRALGKTLTKEHKKKISDSHVGMKHSEVTKQKLSKRVFTEETRRKMSEARKGKSPWLKGKNKYNDERVALISQRMTGRHLSDETKEKLSKVKLGRLSPLRGSHRTRDFKCIYCGKYFDVSNFSRWHGENCKYK